MAALVYENFDVLPQFVKNSLLPIGISSSENISSTTHAQNGFVPFCRIYLLACDRAFSDGPFCNYGNGRISVGNELGNAAAKGLLDSVAASRQGAFSSDNVAHRSELHPKLGCGTDN